MKQAKPKSYGDVGRYEANGKTGCVPGKKMCCRAVLLLIVALLGVELVNLTLWQLGVIPSVPSIFASQVLTCVVSFFVGRVYGMFNK
jgi:hypothetical protein